MNKQVSINFRIMYTFISIEVTTCSDCDLPLFPLQMKNPTSDRSIDTAAMLTIIATVIRSFFFLTLLGEPGEQITSNKFDVGLGCTYNVHILCYYHCGC